MSKSQTRKEQKEKQAVGWMFIGLGLATVALFVSNDRAVAWLFSAAGFVLAGVMFLIDAQRRPLSDRDVPPGQGAE